MTRLAICMDIGTSGLRGQAIDLSSGEVLATAITTCHPLPGGNVIDHVHFAIEMGLVQAQALLIQAVNRVIAGLRVASSDVARLAICGNPGQLSLFRGLEVRDLAYAGSRRLKELGIEPPLREAAICSAAELPGLELPGDCEVLSPPAVSHEVGADALALIVEAGLEDCAETTIAIDYGTNAEMALAHEGRIFTGSAAAGPALEGQHITCGTLARPGAVSDLEPAGPGHRLIVLGPEMLPVPGALIDLSRPGDDQPAGVPQAVALTGTGVIAALDQGIEAGLVDGPLICTADRRLHFGKGLTFTEADLSEAGKAIGAIRAGYFTLCVEAGIAPADLHQACLAGASGTYVDAQKAARLGLIPPCVQAVRQLGNTSLAMARALALEPGRLDALDALARALRPTHCLFASSKTFSSVYLLELAHWTEGMPMSRYRELLRRYRLPDLPRPERIPEVVREVTEGMNDLGDLGRMGMVTLDRFGGGATQSPRGCIGCAACVEACPAGALSMAVGAADPAVSLEPALCRGVACRRCERACAPKVLALEGFFGGGCGGRSPSVSS